MQLIRDVVSDLWQFVASEIRRPKQVPDRIVSAPSPQLQSVAHMVAPTTPQMAVTVSSVSSEEQSVTSDTIDTMMSAGNQYIAYPETPCHLRPAMVRDTIIGTYSYGTLVTVLSRRDDWVRVRAGNLEGWVERFALTSDQTDVFPSLTVGEQYDAEHPETIKLRTYINDEFNVRILRTPLLNCEYVWYRSMRAGRLFSWPIVRPRSPGRWREILRTESSVVCSSVPLTGSIMEYTDGESVGHLYYVESVSPDESVSVSGMSALDSGEYLTHTYAATEMRKLQPTFLCKV